RAAFPSYEGRSFFVPRVQDGPRSLDACTARRGALCRAHVRRRRLEPGSVRLRSLATVAPSRLGDAHSENAAEYRRVHLRCSCRGLHPVRQNDRVAEGPLLFSQRSDELIDEIACLALKLDELGHGTGGFIDKMVERRKSFGFVEMLFVR